MKKVVCRSFIMVAVMVAIALWMLPAETKAESDEEVWKWNKKDVITVTKGAFTYKAYLSDDGKESWVYRVKINEKKETNTLRFPKKIKGAKVTKIGRELNTEDSDICHNVFGNFVEWYHGGDGYKKNMKKIKKVLIPDTVYNITEYSFAGLRNVEFIRLPKRLKKINNRVFLNCKKLKQITVPKDTTEVSVTAFDKCKNLATIKVDKRNELYKAKNGMLLSNNMKILYYIIPKIDTINIPDGVKKIEEHALYGCRATKIVIPKSLSKIASKALNLKNAATVEIDAENKIYAKDGQCIYNKVTNDLVAVINTGKSIKISGYVETIPGEVSVIGNPAEYIEIPKSVKKLELYWTDIANSSYKTRIKFESDTPPYIDSDIPAYVYARFPVCSTLLVPKESISEYKAWVKENESDSYCSIEEY